MCAVSHLDIMFLRAAPALIMIRYGFKAAVSLDRAPNCCAPDAVLSLQVTCWAYHALWPLNVTLAFNVRLLRACLGAPWVYLSGGYRPVVNPADPHCRVIASGPALTHVKRGRKWRSDSLKQLCGGTPFVGPSPFNPSSRLRSVYYSICLSTEVHAAGTRHTEAWAMNAETRRQSDNVILISRNWRMTLRGYVGTSASMCRPRCFNLSLNDSLSFSCCCCCTKRLRPTRNSCLRHLTCTLCQ